MPEATGGDEGEPLSELIPCEASELSLTAGPTSGLTALHEVDTSPTTFGGTRLLQVDGHEIIFVEEGTIYSVSVMGGEPVQLAPAPKETYNVADGQLLIQMSSTTDDMVHQWLAPFDDPDKRTQIPSYVGALWHEIDEGWVIYEVREPDHGIWAAAIPDGTPSELVSGILPDDLKIHNGYLYYEYSDFGSAFARVPLAGGTPEELPGVSSLVGAMFIGDGLYSRSSYGGASGGPGTLYHVPSLPDGMSEIIYQGDEQYELGGVHATADGVYYGTSDSVCANLYFATNASDAELLLSGFHERVGIHFASNEFLIVSDRKHFYRWDL